MDTQVQCPRCGGYEVKVIRSRVSVDASQNQDSGKYISGSDWGGGWGGDWQAFLGVLLVLGLLVVALLALGRALYHRLSHAASASTCTCLQCGFEWTTGQPSPTVSARPALNARSDQPLQEKRGGMSKHTIIWLSAVALVLSLLGILLFFGAASQPVSADASISMGLGLIVILGMLCFLAAVCIGLIAWIGGLVKSAKRHSWDWFAAILLLGNLGTLLYGLNLSSQESVMTGGASLPSASFP